MRTEIQRDPAREDRMMMEPLLQSAGVFRVWLQALSRRYKTRVQWIANQQDPVFTEALVIQIEDQEEKLRLVLTLDITKLEGREGHVILPVARLTQLSYQNGEMMDQRMLFFHPAHSGSVAIGQSDDALSALARSGLAHTLIGYEDTATAVGISQLVARIIDRLLPDAYYELKGPPFVPMLVDP